MSSLQVTWEDPSLWRKVHNLWISELYHALKPQVAGKLSLSIDEEVTLVETEGPPRRLRPDLHLTEGFSQGKENREAKPLPGAVAYAEGTEDCATESRHYLVLGDLSGKRVVGVLEILSPTNKGYYSRFDLDFRRSGVVRRARRCQAPFQGLRGGWRALSQQCRGIAVSTAWWNAILTGRSRNRSLRAGFK